MGDNRLSRIKDDKYYTPPDIAHHCVEKAVEIIGISNINYILEPSAGNGVFIPYFPEGIKWTAIDIDPEGSNIIQQDFLTYDINYCKGLLIIGNPPFGDKMSLAQRFYKKSCEISDYIAFILPISQLNNQSSLYQFDLLHSEDLGKRIYTDRELHCCFNIYKRPKSGVNKKKKPFLKDVSIYRQDSKGYIDRDFDIRMCYWGDGTAGKILAEGENYSAEYKIKCNNLDNKDDIILFLSKFDWKEYLNCIAMRKIQQFHIIDVLKKNISGIE